MRAVFAASGTTGDVQPMIALAEEWRRQGHAAVFGLPWNLVAHARRAGYEATQIGPDLRATFDPLQREYSQGGVTAPTARAYSEALVAAIPQMMTELLALCQEADVLVGTDGMRLGRLISDLTGLPHVSVQICFPPSQLLDGSGPPIGPAEGLNPVRAAYGLPPLTDPEQDKLSAQLALFEVSPRLLPPDPAWPEHFRVTGFFFVGDAPDYQPESGLAEFMAAEPTPIVIDLGSTTYDDPNQLTGLLVDAVDRAGVRAVIQRGWADLGRAQPTSGSTFFTGYAPHTWLFHRAAAVVCHGGCGTIAEAYRAGVPTVAIPAAFDHFRFVDQVERAGWTREIIPFRELSAERLAAAIRRTVGNADYRSWARELQAVVCAENGVGTAYKEIARMLRG